MIIEGRWIVDVKFQNGETEEERKEVMKVLAAAIGRGDAELKCDQATGGSSKHGGFEYAAYVWNKKLQEYEMVSRPVASELLCRNRYDEYVRNGLLDERYDTSNVVFRKRTVFSFLGQWKNIEED